MRRRLKAVRKAQGPNVWGRLDRQAGIRISSASPYIAGRCAPITDVNVEVTALVGVAVATTTPLVGGSADPNETIRVKIT